MSETFQEIKALEAQIERAKVAVEQRNMIDKLHGNREFRKLIIEGFMKDECARLTHMSTDPNISEGAKQDALLTAQAAGALKRWLNALITLGNRAEQDIVEANEHLAELRALDQE